MTGLVVVAVGTGVWALFGSGVATWIHVAVDVVAVAYGILVFRSGRRRLERLRKVRSLSRHPLADRSASWPSMNNNIRLDDEPLFLDESVAL